LPKLTKGLLVILDIALDLVDLPFVATDLGRNLLELFVAVCLVSFLGLTWIRIQVK
jgi:hypothetical protein